MYSHILIKSDYKSKHQIILIIKLVVGKNQMLELKEHIQCPGFNEAWNSIYSVDNVSPINTHPNGLNNFRLSKWNTCNLSLLVVVENNDVCFRKLWSPEQNNA